MRVKSFLEWGAYVGVSLAVGVGVGKVAYNYMSRNQFIDYYDDDYKINRVEYFGFTEGETLSRASSALLGFASGGLVFYLCAIATACKKLEDEVRS